MPQMGMRPIRFTLHNTLTAWQFGPFAVAVLVACVAAAVWYLRADWALAARGRRWSVRRTAPMMAGLLAIDLAIQSPIASFTASYFQAHVIQHLLLMIGAPALCALGAPMTLLLQTSSRRTKTFWLRILHSDAFAALSHPLVVWVLYYGVMIAFFLTPALGYAMAHMWVMDLINIGFLFGASLFWWPMIGLDPIPRWSFGYPLRIANLLIGVPLESFLAIALLSSRTPIAPIYTLSSSHVGAAELWILTELMTAIAVIPIYFQWMASEDRKSVREDARLDATEAVARSGAQVGAGASAPEAPPARSGPLADHSDWLPYRPYAR